jgi:Fe-S-cluster containining protein
VSRCTGQCCETFSLEFSPEALAAEADRLIALGCAPDDPHVQEVRQIAAMALPVGLFTSNPGFATIYDDLYDPGSRPTWWYTCIHLSHTGDCTIYEQRPLMCRNFPRYDRGTRCSYVGCTWEDVTYQLVPAHRLVRRHALRAVPKDPITGGTRAVPPGPDEPGHLDKA